MIKNIIEAHIFVKQSLLTLPKTVLNKRKSSAVSNIKIMGEKTYQGSKNLIHKNAQSMVSKTYSLKFVSAH